MSDTIREFIARASLKRFTLDGEDVTDSDVLAALARLEVDGRDSHEAWKATEKQLAAASSERDKYRDALREIQRVCVNEPDAVEAATRAADIARAALRDDTALAGPVAPPENCQFGCCGWLPDGEVTRYAPHPPDCRYCLEDAVGMDALGRPACREHIEQVADDTAAVPSETCAEGGEFPCGPHCDTGAGCAAVPSDDAEGERYVVSDERRAEIEAMLDADHPVHGVDTYRLAGAVYDLLAERDAAPGEEHDG